jgi:hypothetical protein
LIDCPRVLFLIYGSFSLRQSLDRRFIFCLSITDRIELPIAVITTRLYSDFGVDFMADLCQPRGKVGRDV